MAHKKAAWSAKNLRDSKPKYRWVKVFWWQTVSAWNIIIRQKWNKYEAGKNTYIAKDFSIHSNIEWVVEFSKANKRRFDNRRYLKTTVSVVPLTKIEEEKDSPKLESKKSPAKKVVTKKPAAKKATATKKPAAKKTATKVEKKVATKKATTTKKTPTKKATATKKPAAKKTTKK